MEQVRTALFRAVNAVNQNLAFLITDKIAGACTEQIIFKECALQNVQLLAGKQRSDQVPLLIIGRAGKYNSGLFGFYGRLHILAFPGAGSVYDILEVVTVPDISNVFSNAVGYIAF